MTFTAKLLQIFIQKFYRIFSEVVFYPHIFWPIPFLVATETKMLKNGEKYFHNCLLRNVCCIRLRLYRIIYHVGLYRFYAF